MEERGVDIATAVNVETVVHQRARGADLYAVGGEPYRVAGDWPRREIENSRCASKPR